MNEVYNLSDGPGIYELLMSDPEIRKHCDYMHKKYGYLFTENNAPIKSDLERIDDMKDEDIDYSDSPELTPGWFKEAVIRVNE